MMISELVPVAAAVTAIIAAVAAFLQNRKKPLLDEQQAAAIALQVKKSDRELNLARDRRTLELEVWGDRMRPVIYQIRDRDDRMCAILKEQSIALNLPIPDIPPFPEIPEFPKPHPASELGMT